MAPILDPRMLSILDKPIHAIGVELTRHQDFADAPTWVSFA